MLPILNYIFVAFIILNDVQCITEGTFNNSLLHLPNNDYFRTMSPQQFNSWVNWMLGLKEPIFALEEWKGSECHRPCISGVKPRVCYYKFTLEHYHAMGPACGNCSRGVVSDCNAFACIPVDGIERGVKSINRQIPAPQIDVCKNDLIVVDVTNQMVGAETSIHWHGLHQRKTPFMDGVPYVTQCPIEYSTRFRYYFHASESGTQFYHSHAGHQRVDGLFGALIVRESTETDLNAHLYDFDLSDHVMIAADWMHEISEMFIPGLPSRPSGIRPDTILINGKGRYTDSTTKIITKTPYAVFRVEKGYSYRFRFINSASHVCPLQLQIENHTMTIIATDSFATKPQPVNTLISGGGERFDFILSTNQNPAEYWIRLTALGACTTYNIEQFAILSYAPQTIDDVELSNPFSLPPIEPFVAGDYMNYPNTTCFQPGDDKYCVSDLESYTYDSQLETSDTNYVFTLSFLNYRLDNKMFFQENNYEHFMNLFGSLVFTGAINNISLTFPSFSLLTQSNEITDQLFCSESNLPESCWDRAQCPCIHRLHIELNSIVELIIVDESTTIGQLNHPFHMHGGAFRIMGMGQHPAGIPMTRALAESLYLTKRLITKPINHNAPLKDTVSIPSRGYAVVRFHANNPGFWLLHCHFDWHLGIGMALIIQVGQLNEMVKAPEQFPKCGNYLPDIKENDI